ncbi:hypothetical protein D1007_34204 [Hordeum vulgare]|nr:hypothetical protein D1007_34204 [Hordeum vulgare]
MDAATPGGGGVVGGYGDLPGLGSNYHVGPDDSRSSYDTGDEEEEEEPHVHGATGAVSRDVVGQPHHKPSMDQWSRLDDVIWDARIHFDAGHNLDMKICSSDVTFLNMYALLTVLGFNFNDELYHVKNTVVGADIKHGLELIDTNIKLQQLKKQYEDSFVLNLLGRATTHVSSGFVREGVINQRVDDLAT